MKTIPQRTLRNHSGAVLRQVEAGEQFVITAQGRPVAMLGPYERAGGFPLPRSERSCERLPTPRYSTICAGSRADSPQEPWEH